MDGATTLAHTTSDRTKKIKENTEGVAAREWGNEWNSSPRKVPLSDFKR
jgi:hypothetical protein